ncbi:MAG: rhomboid family intramembrane serine protease [Treponema sp.]|nr:rhomboid family intramembrane serine protease [Treponema sp.]
MNKKKINLKATFDSPFTVSFVILSILVMGIDVYVFKNSLNLAYLVSPTSSNGAFPFNFTDATSYLRLVLCFLGHGEPSAFLCDLIFILLVGVNIEDKYGSIVIGIMSFVSVIFSAVLNACFAKESFYGVSSVIFMMLILNIMLHFSKGKVALSSLFILGLFVAKEIFMKKSNGLLGVAIEVAGGLCGSLFAFLVSPKAQNQLNVEKNGLLGKASKSLEDEIDSRSPRNKKTTASNDETVVGSIRFD